ncbi:MAG: prephenate dehydrogenase/arogenate dehydrogenase family protein [Candidatus Bathyarchaeia archaeon]
MELQNKTIAILGATGRMGKWFTSFFKSKGAKVTLWGRSPERTKDVALSLGVIAATSLQDAVRDKDLVLVATSIDSTPAIVRAAASYASQNTLIFDIASLKEESVDALEDATRLGLKAVSVHPMFGPGADGFAGHKVILIPVSNDESLPELKNVFENAGAEVHVMKSAKSHDKIIAFTLGLPHFLNMSLGMILRDENIAELKKYSGTTFGLQLLISESVLSDEPAQYAEIQIRNSHFLAILDRLQKVTEELQKAVRKRDQTEFVNIFQSIRDSYSREPEFKEAYERFYRAWAAAVLRPNGNSTAT